MITSHLKTYVPRDIRDFVFAVRQHKRAHGRFPRLLRPQTFNEKILRRKVFDRRPIFTTFADKYAVRQFVAERVGEDILPALHFVTADPRTLPFDELPNRFVVKPTHGSGMVRVVLDKATLDRDELVRTCWKWLATNYYERLREYQYKKIEPRIIVEEFVDDGTGLAPRDYKFFVFDGRVRLIQVDGDRFTAHRRSLYDRNWDDSGCRLQYQRIEEELPRPANFDAMVAIAEQLAQGVEFVRVDLYDTGNSIYFGEMTATPGCGLEQFEPKAMDVQLGKLWPAR